MPEIVVEFEVFCAKCGAGLCNTCTTGTTPRRNIPFVQVEPCDKCLDDAIGKGWDEGYEQAQKEMSDV